MRVFVKKKNVLTLCTYRYKCRNLYRGVKQIGLVMIVKKKINYGIRVLGRREKNGSCIGFLGNE